MKKVITLNNREEQDIRDYLERKKLPTDTSVTFGDVWIPEGYSEVRSRREIWGSPEKSFRTKLTDDISLNYPVFSANMSSVTGLDMALSMLRIGGGYFLPQMLNLEDRLRMLESIRRADCAYIEDPITTDYFTKLGEAKKKMEKYGIWSLIIINSENKPMGVLSSRDFRYETNDDIPVSALMSHPVKTCKSTDGIEAAKKIIKREKIEKVPVVDEDGRLVGLYTAHGAFYEMRHPRATRTAIGQFPIFGSVKVGRALTGETIKEIESQIKIGAKVILVDTARAFAVNMEEIVKFLKGNFPGVLIVGGNVSTAEGTKALFEWGVDVVKVNQGRGSQCLTSLQTGIGQSQITALAKSAVIAKRYNGMIIADGGMKSPGDWVKAFIAGAHFIMSGSMLVGTHESPAEVASRLYEGKEFLVKKYEGSASYEAQKKRIVEGTLDELREPEGDWEYVPLTGGVYDKMHGVFRAISSSMTYFGAETLEDLRENGYFGGTLQTRAGNIEGTKNRAK